MEGITHGIALKQKTSGKGSGSATFVCIRNSRRAFENTDCWVPSISEAVGLEWDQKICISNKLQVLLVLFVQGSHLDNHLSEVYKKSCRKGRVYNLK